MLKFVSTSTAVSVKKPRSVKCRSRRPQPQHARRAGPARGSVAPAPAPSAGSRCGGHRPARSPRRRRQAGRVRFAMTSPRPPLLHAHGIGRAATPLARSSPTLQDSTPHWATARRAAGRRCAAARVRSLACMARLIFLRVGDGSVALVGRSQRTAKESACRGHTHIWFIQFSPGKKSRSMYFSI